MLDQAYQDRLTAIANAIQESDVLARYLEEEEEEDYQALRDAYEPYLLELYQEVAAAQPLQIIPLEEAILEAPLEGLFLPKLVGYSVLRGAVNEHEKYSLPQTHFQKVLAAICDSANFDILKKRIGQAIQIGFAMSSDIWVTNLINSFDNKRVRYYLQSQKLDRYRDPKFRMQGRNRFLRQFRNDNFLTADFPTTANELKVLFPGLMNFLTYRVKKQSDNTALVEPLMTFIKNDALQGQLEYTQIATLFAAFVTLDDADRKALGATLDEVRKKHPSFQEEMLDFILQMHHDNDLDFNPDADQLMAATLDLSIKDNLSAYFNLMQEVHDKGYINEPAQDAIRVFYAQYEGLSTINENVRMTIYHYFRRFITNLEEADYQEFFGITKYFPTYMDIFNNEQFNQDLKSLSMDYVKRLLKRYTDKRGRDYQDIKKFVSTTFQDLSFLKEKQVVELFKTRRKRKKATE